MNLSDTKKSIIILSVLIFISISHISAQTKRKIGIAFAADTTMICQYLGFFKDRIYPLSLDIPLKNYMENRLKEELEKSEKYHNDVTILNVYERLMPLENSILFDKKSKKVIFKICKITDDYDFIIFTKNVHIPDQYVNGIIIPNRIQNRANGLLIYKLSKPYLYTTIGFYIYDVNKEKFIHYNNLDGINGNFQSCKLNNFEKPKDDINITDDMIEFLTFEMKNFINQRIYRFTAKTGLVPENKIEKEKFIDDIYGR